MSRRREGKGRSKRGTEASARVSQTAGLSPGTLVHVGERKVDQPRITVIDYDGDHFLEKEVATVEECFPFHLTSTVTWINIDGVHDPEVVEKLGRAFGLHALVLEDIMNTAQRPKLEDLGEAMYAVLKMIEMGDGGTNGEVVTDQLSLVFGRNYVLSFQERPGDMFDVIRERIRRGKGRIRSLGPDYLAYTLIDAVVDHYFVVLERFGDTIETLEDALLANPNQATLHRIHALKREMLFLRKSVWPLRELLAGMERAESSLIAPATNIFLRDVYDHTIQVIDNVETFRDMLSGMIETYLSSVSNRMNEVMKVLTVISTIFIPLTFLAGVYGMNFKHMPELEWRHGYFFALGIMIAVGGAMVLYFRRKKWF